TDFGLRSQWLDMTNTDHTETFGLYAAVLRKSDPSPFLPESDEEGATTAGSGNPGGRGGGRGAAAAGETESGPAAPVSRSPAPAVTIDFDGLEHRILSVPGIANRPYANLKAGLAGMVYFTETGAGAPVLHRYSLRDRRSVAFVTGATDYDVSLDGHKL